MSKHTEKYERAKKAVDSEVKDWNKTTLSDIEKYAIEYWLIHGMVKAFLYFLNFDEYNDIKEYIWQEYGFNCGGTSGDWAKEATNDKGSNGNPQGHDQGI